MQRDEDIVRQESSGFCPVLINDKAIDVVANVKLLGLNITNDLKWNCHVSEIIRKVSTRLYFLKQLRRANVPTKELLTFYVTCIRPQNMHVQCSGHNGLPKFFIK